MGGEVKGEGEGGERVTGKGTTGGITTLEIDYPSSSCFILTL